MKTEKAVREAVQRCEATVVELAKWRGRPYCTKSKSVVKPVPACWMGGTCLPEECNAREAMSWVLDE